MERTNELQLNSLQLKKRSASGCQTMLDRKAVMLMVERRDAIVEWLDDTAPYTAVDQRHLDSDTAERAYWHFGYQAALTDILNLISQENRAYGSAGKPN